MVAGDCTTPVPFPNNTAFDVNVEAPVPPYVAAMMDPFHVPDVIFPPTLKSVPMYNFFATPTPPAVISDPVTEEELSVISNRDNCPEAILNVDSGLILFKLTVVIIN